VGLFLFLGENMAQVRNVSPLGDLDVPVLGKTVPAGEVVEVPDDLLEAFLEQPANWAAVKATKTQPSTPAEPTTPAENK
jgi:hypothetical protein